jgi:hypothetical protein
MFVMVEDAAKTLCQFACIVLSTIHPPNCCANSFVLMSLFRERYSARTSTGNTGGNNNPTLTPDRSFRPDPSTTTPTCGTRRCRDDDEYYNFEDDIVITRPAGTFPITPGMSKHLKTSSEDIAHHYEVDPQQLVPFVEVCQYHFNLFNLSYSTCSPKQCCTCCSTWRRTSPRLKTCSPKKNSMRCSTPLSSRYVLHLLCTIISNSDSLDRFARSSPCGLAVPWHTSVCDRCHTTDDGKSLQLKVYYIIIVY